MSHEDANAENSEKDTTDVDAATNAAKAESETAPDDYRKKYEDMRSHSRTWENRAEKSLAQVEKLTADKEKLESTIKDLQSELSTAHSQVEDAQHNRDLIIHIAALGGDVEQLFDSKSFCAAVDKINSDDDDYESTLKDLIGKHSPAAPSPSRLTWESPNQGISRGEELWQRRQRRQGA